MVISMLVLVSVLLAFIGITLSFIRPWPIAVIDESEIRTAEQLDAALRTQRAMRISELRQRMATRDYLLYAIFGSAMLLQMTAYVVDHFAHPSIMAITLLPAFFTAFTVRSALRRDAQHQYDAVTGGGSTPA